MMEIILAGFMLIATLFIAIRNLIEALEEQGGKRAISCFLSATGFVAFIYVLKEVFWGL
jgi:hypothetical protein